MSTFHGETSVQLKAGVRIIAGFMILALGWPTLARAQAEARFTGTVRDQSGAFVPGAEVVVKNEKTGDARTVLSNPDGFYVVTGLRPSVYTVRATAPDFAATEYTGLQLLPAQELTIDLELRPAGVSETVTVTGGVQTIDLSSARIGTNVIEREVKDLPINGRQMSQLYLQAPGSVNSGTGTFSDIRFSGPSRPR
jgi:hypothetical protein